MRRFSQAAVVAAIMIACSPPSGDGITIRERLIEGPDKHLRGILATHVMVDSDEEQEILSARAIADDGLVTRIPGECDPGCPGSGVYDEDIGEPGSEFPALAFPVRMGPGRPARLMLLVESTGDGKQTLAEGQRCLYVRAIELELKDGPVTVGWDGDEDDPWVYAVTPDDRKCPSATGRDGPACRPRAHARTPHDRCEISVVWLSPHRRIFLGDLSQVGRMFRPCHSPRLTPRRRP